MFVKICNIITLFLNTNFKSNLEKTIYQLVLFQEKIFDQLKYQKVNVIAMKKDDFPV